MESIPAGPLTFYSIIILGVFFFVLGGIFVLNGYASEFIGGVNGCRADYGICGERPVAP